MISKIIKISKLVLLLLFIVTGVTAQQKVKKALFIIADGIPADVIEKLSTPNLKAIAKQGAYLRAHVGGDKDAYNQTPTISAVGYNSLLTGTWYNKHNVPDNDIKNPNYNYPTIFRLLKDQYPNKKIAVFSSWLDNRTKLVGDGLDQTNKIHVDYHADGFELDTINFKHDKESAYMHRIDEKVVEEASASIRENAPDMSWVYLEYTDDMGHRYGDSPQYYSAIEMMDKQVGKIWAAIQYRQQKFNEEWQIFITTDHGRDERTGKNHGGQSVRQRSTWIVTNAKGLNSYARYYYPGIVDIMPTIARFMNINTPLKFKQEIDGTPLTGAVSIAELKANLIQGNIDVSWKAFNKGEKVKVWVTATNNFKEGKPDNYKLLGEYAADTEHALISVNDMPSTFYKVVAEGEFNTLNRWVTPEVRK
jgi:predicted AlkP superfamily pyrophosphatase or phosphodiesterase